MNEGTGQLTIRLTSLLQRQTYTESACMTLDSVLPPSLKHHPQHLFVLLGH